MCNILKQQVERILDEAPGDECQVIVQTNPTKGMERYLQATTEALDKRRAIVSARSLVPPEFFQGKKRWSVNRRGGNASSWSVLAQPKLAEFVAHHEKRILKKSAYQTLGRMMKWAKDEGSRKTAPVPFWSSSSLSLKMSKDKLKKLSNRPDVAAVFLNRSVRVPPVYRAQGEPESVADNKAYTWGLSRTGAMACWGAFEARGKGVKIAVLDTGIDTQHPDLRGKVCGYVEFDNSGKVTRDGLQYAQDDHGHGTHCAGVIAGGSASGRFIGMAPHANILAASVLKNGTGSDAQILAGIEWAIENDADVISMSLGGLRLSADVLDTYTLAIITANRRGIPVVVAIGNDGSQTTGSPGNDFFAFTVGATDVRDMAAGFSGGRTQIIEQSRYITPKDLPVVYSKPDVTAPGVDIYSCVPGNKWASWSGTSMATPHVAGAIALLLGRPTKLKLNFQGLERVNALQSLLISSVKELGEAGQNHRFGHGRIDVLRAFGYGKELGYL